MRSQIGLAVLMFLGLLGMGLPAGGVLSQTITVVGTPHLSGLDRAPTDEQLAKVVDRLAGFEPTQVCVERMGGERIQAQLLDQKQHGMTFQPETHGRPLATVIVPAGYEMRGKLERGPVAARREARNLLQEWGSLELADRIRAIGLLVAGFEFHSAVLNWSYLDEAEREAAGEVLGALTVDGLNSILESDHEAYSLAVPLARRSGLHELCTADALEDETRGMRTAVEHGGMDVIESAEVQERLEEHRVIMMEAWQPDAGEEALVSLLRYTNSEDYEAMDRELQWETLRRFDNDEGAFQRRLMYWHARTAEISAELYRALAQGSDERVLFIVGAAHRPFTEADLRSQPWLEVKPARELLSDDTQ
ncbi:hypothetical protein J2T60_001215 [Natronospira proteinivora]|uniref:TraB/GumN family protein n=1 Tax=Natronospira proteinivora TaxID=1807133 RepID=A0ABT1G7I2_9GAMM|nr:DUF5694 domain-containing protein [Natronospira proteinivora]MCP1727250.1 hypothetical protein [Natronospira proteinivora]